MPIVSNRISSSRKNIDKTKRNGAQEESRTVIKYITNMGKDGTSGEDAFQIILSPNNQTFIADSNNAIAQTYTVNVIGYRGLTRINTLILDSSIEGTIEDALDVSVVAGTNGTNQAQFTISVTDELSANNGQLIIPVQYNVNTYDSSTVYDASAWDPALYTLATFNAVYSWTLGKTGQSTYILDLSNETASINADTDGSIISTAVRPPCQATLAFGSNTNLNGVYYDASWSMSGVTGLGINHYTGQVLYDSDAHSHDSKFPSGSFNFGDASTNTVLDINIDASYDGRVRARKVMSITKILPGQQGPAGDTPYIGSNGNWWVGNTDTGVKAEGEDGSAAVSRWIELSANQVKIDASNNIIPSTINATAWKQVGGNTPTTDSQTTIKWGHDTSVCSSTSLPVTVQSSWDYITFKLFLGNTYIGESETVPILKDGADGVQGPRGAAIRGPVLWDSSSNVNVSGLAKRWFYCGVQTHDNRPAEANFIDVILHNGQYYMCIDNYEQSAGASWSSVSSKWQAADSSYNFVAANVILAKNAGIDFLTGNEIYLRDPSGNITAGAAGGNGISFWAGHHYATSAPFQVNYDGTMTATKGSFGCLSIGIDASRNNQSVLQGSVSENDYVHSLVLDPEGFSMTGILRDWQDTYNIESESLRIRPLIDSDRFDDGGKGAIYINYNYTDPSAESRLSDSSLYLYYRSYATDRYAFNTNESVYSGRYVQDTWNINNGTGSSGVVTTPGLFGLEVVFVTANDSSALFTKDTLTGHWLFAGMDTGFEYGLANYSKLARVGDIVGTNPSTGSGETFVKTTSPRTHYNTSDPQWGHWVFYYSQYGFYESGVISETSQRLPNVIYIKV